MKSTFRTKLSSISSPIAPFLLVPSVRRRMRGTGKKAAREGRRRSPAV
jgi:hypothetical protein